VARQQRDRWIILRSGDAMIATFVTALRGVAEPVVFALLTEGSTR
jgi:hypothetical protein